ncbi:MAG: ribonuclease Y, partial [Clostridia bacterium]|nr:ribonuclease Y [Clostridia bacterium]
MDKIIIGLIALVIGVIGGAIFGFMYRKNSAEKEIGSAEDEAKRIINDAIRTAEAKKREALVEAKDEIHKSRSEFEKEYKERRSELQKSERRLLQKEENLDKKYETVEQKEEKLNAKIKEADKQLDEINQLKKGQLEMLEKISGLTSEEAKNLIVKQAEQDAKHDVAVKYKEIERQLKEDADMKARELISLAIQRCASDHASEATVSAVSLPNDEMKGRIIGREGRNIRTIETLTGVDLIIDDTPEAVILSGFDPVRREIARIALEKLIVDGRIHPARIEEMVEKAEKEVNAIIKEEGEQATFEVGIHNLHPELVKLLGRLRFRTSYGQNVLKHSVEVAHLAGLMAGELGLDVKLAKRAGLLHDIGKALDHEVEGTHVDIGIDVLRRYKESEAVINGMAAHHGDYEAKSMEAVLIAAADALSAARPGARRETLDAYIKRLEKLEEIANTTPGVEKSFAIQAGREIRIIAKPEDVNDEEIVFLAREISKKIEAELEYPGQIKVNVVRETRAID